MRQPPKLGPLTECVGAVLHLLRRALPRAESTLAVVAVRAGLSLGYLSQVERGRNQMSLEMLGRLVPVLGLTLPEFFRLVEAELTRRTASREPDPPTG